MSFILETTDQYDATKYSPLGTVIVNNVEGVSFFRALLGAFQGAFGGKNGAIQTAVDRLTERGIVEFKNRVAASYPNTVKVVGLKTSISEAGGDDQQTFLVFHATGTCLGPFGQTGGSSGLRKSRKMPRRRNKRSLRN
jgi:uncharacterized protein YbjQ (UPF0145 family)